MPVIWVGVALAALTVGMPALRPVFMSLFPGVDPPVYGRESFAVLILSQIALVAVSSLIATAIGVAAGIFVTRDAGRDFRPLAGSLAIIGQSFPPAAILALAVPIVGFGATPTIIALSLYGLLPILENTIAGLEGVLPTLREAADGMGFSPSQRLRKIELPLAAPSIMAGIRTSVAVGIGTATIGSTVGALTLGAPIISGLYSDKLSWALQGALLAGLLAVFADLSFATLAHWMDRRR